MSNIDKHAELRKELSNPAIGSSAHLRKLALAMLDELEAKEEQRANWFQMAEKLGADLDAAEKWIAELEARKPDLYLCRVNRGGEEVYSPCGKDYPRGRGYIAASSPKGE